MVVLRPNPGAEGEAQGLLAFEKSAYQDQDLPYGRCDADCVVAPHALGNGGQAAGLASPDAHV